MSTRFLAAGILGCLIVPLAVAAQQPQPAVRLASTWPETERASFERAVFEFENYGDARADRQFDELLKARPESGLLRALWANASVNLTAAQRTRELERAVQDAAKGSTAELVLVAAIRDNRAGRPGDALTTLDAAAHLLPVEPLVEFYRIGWTADPAEKLRVAEAAHEKFPSDPGIMNRLAVARYDAGFTKEGLALAEQYAQAVSQHPNGHDRWAFLLHQEGDLVGAAQHYQRALDLDSGWLLGYRGLANVAISRGDYRTALIQVQAAIPLSREPMERVNALFNAGATAALANDAVAMRQYYNQIITLAEANELPAVTRNARQWLGFMEAVLGNRRQAEELLAHPAINTPAYVHFGLVKAMVYEALNDQQKLDAAVAEQEQATAASGNTGLIKESAHMARLIRASMAGDLAAVRSELPGLSTPNMVSAGNAYLYRALKRARDNRGLADAKAAALEYLTFDSYRMTSVLLTK